MSHVRSHRDRSFSPLRDKTLVNVLRQLFVTEFGYGKKTAFAELMIERILDVVEELELMDWVRALPEGLDTRLESGGRDLSAGEAQLLAFARVFLRDPGLVVLDEASSRLDPATERRVERAVGKLLRDRTAIVIAHRLGTVHRADEIMILEAGRVAEHGGRERLADDPSSRFHSLLQTGLEEVLA